MSKPPEVLRGPTKLPVPPFGYTLNRSAAVSASGNVPKLRQISKKMNQITDTARWFTENGLTQPGAFAPADVPTRVGVLNLVLAIPQVPAGTIVIYGVRRTGNILGVVDGARQLRALFDFDAYRFAPKVAKGDEAYVEQEIQWAEAQGNTLFVAHAHRTYAKSSGGLNAYVTAIDIPSGDVLWRSAPLVANAQSFVVWDGHIFCGYGFTAEPDFLFTLDAATGKTVSKLPLASGAEYLFRRNNKLFVRTYDTDYEFEIS